MIFLIFFRVIAVHYGKNIATKYYINNYQINHNVVSYACNHDRINVLLIVEYIYQCIRKFMILLMDLWICCIQCQI